MNQTMMLSGLDGCPVAVAEFNQLAVRKMRLMLLVIALTLASATCWAGDKPIEIHERMAPRVEAAKSESGVAEMEKRLPDMRLALTLDACTGKFDDDLIEFLITNKIPATIFATKKWLDENPRAVVIIKNHLDLFDVENHGANHIPAVIGSGRKVFGIPGEPDVVYLRREVVEGARAIEETIGVAPHWYRGATAEYDPQAILEITRMGYKIAGFSVNADVGATLNRAAIEERLKHVKAGDVIIAHMNKPSSDTAEGLSVALKHLLNKGFVFVRLDQVELREMPKK